MTPDKAGISCAIAIASERPSSGDFQVFVNFRGPDSRNTVANVIHDALVRAGVQVFYDDESIRQGEVIEEELMEAITNSKIYIPIFSRDSASSKWCLVELAKIMDCGEDSKKKGEKNAVLPIFYIVDAKLSKHVTEVLCCKIGKRSYLDKVPDDFVKMEDPIEDIKKLLDLDIDKGRLTTIHGMSGRGKKTVPRFAFNGISSKFKVKSRRDASIMDLQLQL